MRFLLKDNGSYLSNTFAIFTYFVTFENEIFLSLIDKNRCFLSFSIFLKYKQYVPCMHKSPTQRLWIGEDDVKHERKARELIWRYRIEPISTSDSIFNVFWTNNNIIITVVVCLGVIKYEDDLQSDAYFLFSVFFFF